MELLEAWGVPVLAGKLDGFDVEKVLDYVSTQRFEDAGGVNNQAASKLLTGIC